MIKNFKKQTFALIFFLVVVLLLTLIRNEMEKPQPKTYKKKIVMEFIGNKSSKSKANDFLSRKKIQRYDRNCPPGKEQLLPKAIIIGAAKSGTSTLLNYLKLNPQIKPALKPPYDETNFFTDDVLYLAGYDWYKQQMPEICKEEISKYDKLVVIEKSIYFNTFASIQRIYSYDPNIKLILIVRDPVKCLQSYLTHIDDIHYKRNLKRVNLNINDYFEDLFKSQRSRESIYQELDHNYIVRLCNYHYSMEKWMEYFEPRNFLILDGEKFVKEPWIVLNQVEDFLQVESTISKDNFEFVERKGFYCLKTSFNSTDCMNNFKGRSKKIYLSDVVKKELRTYYTQQNDNFFDLVKQSVEW